VVWEYPSFVIVQRRLASFSRVIRHDMRAAGLSDRAISLPDLEAQVRDARAVLDVAGSHSTVLVGVGLGAYGGLFAVTSRDAPVPWCSSGRWRARERPAGTTTHGGTPTRRCRETFAKCWGPPSRASGSRSRAPARWKSPGYRERLRPALSAGARRRRSAA
jgi:pimeloyl-ACP methyl ester carboxylesterase